MEIEIKYSTYSARDVSGVCKKYHPVSAKRNLKIERDNMVVSECTDIC